MSIPVTRPPLKKGEGKTIFFTMEELVRLDDSLCYYLYDDIGNIREGLTIERIDIINHIIDKINRHI